MHLKIVIAIAIVVIILLIIGYFIYPTYTVTKDISILAFVESNRFKMGGGIVEHEISGDTIKVHQYSLNEKGQIANKRTEVMKYKLEGKEIKILEDNGNVLGNIQRKGNNLLQTTPFGTFLLTHYNKPLPPYASKKEENTE